MEEYLRQSHVLLSVENKKVILIAKCMKTHLVQGGTKVQIKTI